MQNRIVLSPILTGTNFIPKELTNGCSLVATCGGEGVIDTAGTEGPGAGVGAGVGQVGKTPIFETKTIRVKPAAATSDIQTSQIGFFRLGEGVTVTSAFLSFVAWIGCLVRSGFFGGAGTRRGFFSGLGLTLTGSTVGNIWRQAAMFWGRRSGQTAKPASIASRKRLLYLPRNRAASGVYVSRVPARSTA